MSAYAMFPSGALPQLKKKSTPSIPNKITTRKGLSTGKLDKFVSRSTSNLNQEKIDVHSRRPPLSRKISHLINAQTKKGASEPLDEEENDLGIAVKSANLDRKRFIAANSSSSRIKRAGSLDQWEAVEYELSINYDGKKYTAKRSFPRIRRLRHELLREVETRKNNYPGKFGVIRSFVSPLPASDHSTDDSSTESDEDSVIPELPADLCSDDGMDSESPMGLAGRTLNMIQSSATGNCPHLEEWLMRVSKVVHPNTSPSLRSFLAEPLEPEECLPRLFPRARRFLRRRRNRGSFGNLSSISEDDVVDAEERAKLEIECNDNDLPVEDQEEDDDDDSYSEFDLS